MTALVDVSLVSEGDRLRGVSEAQVEALANSIADVGVLNPITVYRTKIMDGSIAKEGYGLIAGLHRLAAVRKLGLADIPAHVVELSELERQIAECDENLCGSKLTPSEKALFTKRRKQAYEALHPETRQGQAQANGMNRAQGNVSANFAPTFTADTANRTGQSERVVQLNAERGNRISEDALNALRGTNLDRGTYLDNLKTLPVGDQVRRVREDLRSTQKPKAAAISDDDATEKQVAGLMAAWNKAGSDARNEFLARIGRVAA